MKDMTKTDTHKHRAPRSKDGGFAVPSCINVLELELIWCRSKKFYRDMQASLGYILSAQLQAAFKFSCACPVGQAYCLSHVFNT